MSHVILQPSGNKDAREHYANTIERPIEISRLSKFIDKSHTDKLKRLYPDGQVPVWGVTPGKNHANKNKWDKIESGDVVLFSGDGKIYASATVSIKLHNKNLLKICWELMLMVIYGNISTF